MHSQRQQISAVAEPLTRALRWLCRYLIPMDLTVGQFVYVIRKRISVPPEKAIFIFVNNMLPPTASLMSQVYEQHKDEDGFMYMMYGGENTFGSLDEAPAEL